MARSEQDLRKEAVRRRLGGESAAQIAQTLGVFDTVGAKVGQSL